MRVTWQLLVLAVVVVILGVGLALQHQANVELRDLIVLLRQQNQEKDRVQGERSRLMKAQISEAELDSLRADHAAVVRLRAEIETAQARIIEMERAEAAGMPSR